MRYFFYNLFILYLIILPAAQASDVKIWAVADQKFISEKKLITKLRLSKNILLGISPDNPDHHARATKIIEKLTKGGREPVILLSYVERNKQNAFAIFIQRHKKTGKDYDATGLDMLLGWSNNGQSEWSVVRPVFDMAMIKNLSLKAVNFSRYEIGELYGQGLDGLPDDVKPALLPLLKTTPQIEQETHKANCETLPPEVVEKFITIRHARNSLFALAMSETRDKTTVLIAPHAHVNIDTGVPHFLNKLTGPGKSISLSFVETGQDVRDRQADYIWYTGEESRPRPCQHHLIN